MNPEQEISRSAAERCLEHDHNPILARMIERDVPLSRNAYLMLAYGAELPGPDEWNAEHEAQVPECFQDPDAVKPRGKRGD